MQHVLLYHSIVFFSFLSFSLYYLNKREKFFSLSVVAAAACLNFFFFLNLFDNLKCVASSLVLVVDDIGFRFWSTIFVFFFFFFFFCYCCGGGFFLMDWFFFCRSLRYSITHLFCYTHLPHPPRAFLSCHNVSPANRCL